MMKKVILSFLALFMLCEHLEARTILRKKDPNIPEITIGWKNSKKRITRSNWAYKEDPSLPHLMNHTLIATTYQQTPYLPKMIPIRSTIAVLSINRSLICYPKLKRQKNNIPILLF